jgi:apolipoprotein N-acyltransferase
VKTLYALLLSLASAGLMAAAQDYRWAAPLAWVGLVPLLLAMARCGFAAVWLRLVFFYSVYLALALFWLRFTGPEMAWLLPMAIGYSWIFMPIPAAAAILARTLPGRLLVLAPAWMAAEILARIAPFHINWNLLGLPLADCPAMAQVAALGGPEATTFLVVLVNAGLAWFMLARRGRWRGIAVAAGAAGSALFFGCLQLWTSPQAETVLRAGLVQPMISQRRVWTPANRVPLLQKMDGLIDAVARRRPDLIVLPEWAVVGNLRYDAGLAQSATGAVRRSGVPVLLGAGDFEAGRFYNAATLITTDGRVSTYRKMRLIPFVEYSPRLLPYEPRGWVRFSPGVDATVFHLLPDIDVAELICLEDTLPDLARQFANGGATVLLALVNTENFAGTPEALQHLRRAQLTAIATGLPMLRAANSGISCALDSRGRILQALPAGRALADIVQLPVAGRATPYRWMGDWPVLGALIALIALGRARV